MQPLSVLLVEESQAHAEIVELLLTKSPHGDFHVEHVPSVREALALVYQQRFDVIILEASLSGCRSLNNIKQVKAAAADTPLIVLTNDDDEEMALEAIRQGAQESLSKEHLIGQLLVRTLRHSVARQHQLREAQAKALTDPLTGIGNRRAFNIELSRCLNDFRRHGTSCCVMLLDLDHFKTVNDHCGHDGGDEVLQGVSQVLCRSLRETDLAARYGGEEFGIILPATPLPDACTTAERVRREITETGWSRQDLSMLITASSGLAELLPDDDELTFLRRADESLYFAKNTGRNRYSWHDGRAPRLASDLSRRVAKL